MRTLYHKFSCLLKEIGEKYSLKVDSPLWEIPKIKRYGDLSTSLALRLSSRLKKPSLEIASLLKASIAKALGDDIQRIEIIKPGFINIFISPQGLLASLNRIIKERQDFFKEKRLRRIIIEFVSANPTGPLSIAHGRQAVIGDVIARVLEFLGDEVTREYYINDEGKQIDLLVESVDERRKELKGEPFKIPEGGYKGDYIKEVAKELIDEEHTTLREKVLDIMLQEIKKELEHLDIHFNSWVSQHRLLKEGKVKAVLDLLDKRGLIYSKDGALWFLSSKFGDDKDRVVKKNDGEYTYFASDIAYHYDKISRNYHKLINLWGPDHHGYIKRVISAIKGLGYSENILEVIIIQLVSLKSKERMSRREGTVILLKELIEKVGKDAARFYYLIRRNSSPLEFDIDLAKQSSFDNPLFYIQYAYARICSIFRKAEVSEFSPSYSKFLDEEDLELVRDVLQFSYCLDKVYYNFEPVFIIDYLKYLATQFHNFYERKRVLDENNKNITYARLNLLEAVRIVIGCGLTLLGIKPLSKM